MADAIVTGRPHRASGELANHVLEIMEAIHVASDQDRHVYLSSRTQRPAPFAAGLAEGEVH
jgi:hypothetical protein